MHENQCRFRNSLLSADANNTLPTCLQKKTEQNKTKAALIFCCWWLWRVSGSYTTLMLSSSMLKMWLTLTKTSLILYLGKRYILNSVFHMTCNVSMELKHQVKVKHQPGYTSSALCPSELIKQGTVWWWWGEVNSGWKWLIFLHGSRKWDVNRCPFLSTAGASQKPSHQSAFVKKSRTTKQHSNQSNNS